MSADLPSPLPSQAYVHVSVLDAGHVALPEHMVVQHGSPTSVPVVPALAFLLRHSHNPSTLILFDLGLRKDWEALPPATVEFINSTLHAFVPMDVVDSLRAGNVEPHQVSTVILSHVHFDHVGNPDLFPIARFVVHEGVRDILAGGYDPGDTASPTYPRISRTLLPDDTRTTFLPVTSEWRPIGPFARAHDFLGDGSIYIVDAPGHIPGHINLLVRTSSDGAWLYLAGDSAHDVRLVTGEKEIAVFPLPNGGMGCMHMDIAAATEHILKIRAVMAIPRVRVLLSHDLPWYEKNKSKGVVFPGEIPSL